MATPSLSSRLPRVAVLLATWNGLRWLAEQVDSILDQAGVEVRLIALDDESTDGTQEWLLERAAADPRITVLTPMGRSGGAAANYYRLLERAEIGADELVALADQDDIWQPGKLARHAAFIIERGAAAVSSSVEAFTADGKSMLVRKDFPQRRFDFLTESPGPGCTFLMRPDLVRLVRSVLERERSLTVAVDFHDSLIYAIARGAGLPWLIDGEPTVRYRQHDANVLGSNTGARPALARLRLIRTRWHRNQAVLHARVARSVAAAPHAGALDRIIELLTNRGARSRLVLTRLAGELRRRPRDRRILGILIALGVW
jgi:rhamnosyltransferase